MLGIAEAGGGGVGRGAPGAGDTGAAVGAGGAGAAACGAGADGAGGAGSGADGVSVGGGGSGWRGPEMIWPGFGRFVGSGGVGRAGIGMPRGATGGTSGDPLNNGGRKGMAARGGAGAASVVSFAGASFFSDSDFGAAVSATGAETDGVVAAGITCGRGVSLASSRDFCETAPEAKCPRTISA